MSPEVEAQCAYLRDTEELTIREIARRLNIGTKTVRVCRERYYDRLGQTPPKIGRLGVYLTGGMRAAQAYRLLAQGMPLEQVVQITGYKDKTQVHAAVARHRTATGAPRVIPQAGKLRVTRKKKYPILDLGVTQLRTCAWDPGQDITWYIVQECLVLLAWEAPGSGYTCGPNDINARIFYERAVNRRPWRDLSREFGKPISTLRDMAQRHVDRNPQLAHALSTRSLKARTGIVRMARSGSQKLILELPLRHLQWEIGETIFWQKRKKGLLLSNTRQQDTSSQV
jgi:hypothetical protein